MRRVALVALAVVLMVACTDGGPAVEPTPSGSTVPSGGASSGARWTRMPDAPTARLEVAAAAAGGKIYVAGGLTESGATALVEIYDPRTEQWSRAHDLPVALHHASAFVWRDTFMVAGGYRGGRAIFDAASDAVYALGCPPTFKCRSAISDDWIQIATMPRARGAAAAGVIDDRLVVSGGQAANKVLAETDIFSFVTKRWRTGAPMPTPREHLASATGDGFLYTVGGRRLGINNVIPALERYDLARDRWQQLPEPPTARGGFGAAVFDGRVIALGGEGPKGTYGQVEMFDPTARTWSRLPDMPQARHGIGVVLFELEEPHLFAIVGGPVAGGSYARRVDALVFERS